MPIVSTEASENYIWGLWHITETEATLAEKLSGSEIIPESITNNQKRVEFLSARLLLKNLLSSWGYTFDGLYKDAAGKPFFNTHPFHLSLTHSFPYVAAVIHRKINVGIDLEQPKAKLLNIAERVLNEKELQNAGKDIVKHCVYWCAKETLIKIYGKRHLHLAKELAIAPFELKNEGWLIGSILAADLSVDLPLYYKVYDNFVIVLNT